MPDRTQRVNGGDKGAFPEEEGAAVGKSTSARVRSWASALVAMVTEGGRRRAGMRSGL